MDKLIKKTNLALVIGTHSWREQFLEAITVSAGKWGGRREEEREKWDGEAERDRNERQDRERERGTRREGQREKEKENKKDTQRETQRKRNRDTER